MKRAGLRTSTLAVSAVLAAATFTGPAPAAEELRIGFIAPKTGIFSQLGIDMQNGFQMYLDEHNGELGGAKVNLIVEDDQGKPDTGVTKANKLILSDRVHMLVGGVLATTGYALAPVAKTMVGNSMPRQASLEWLTIVPIAESRSSYNGLLVFAFVLLSGSIASIWCSHAYRSARRPMTSSTSTTGCPCSSSSPTTTSGSARPPPNID